MVDDPSRRVPADDDLVRIEIEDMEVDPITNMPVVLLKILDGGRVFPFWVGMFEANAIALERDGMVTPRPMTHDLLKDSIQAMGGDVTHVVVSDLRDDTFFATVFIRQAGKDIRLDSRPSDALSLALRFKAPIYVAKVVLEQLTTYEGRVDYKAAADEFVRNNGLPPEDPSE